jgi:hypothetical protein
MPELINTATRRKLRPPQLENFIVAFSVAGHKQQKAAEEKTVTLLKRLSGSADVEKARAAFECAQRVEETFHKDFDGVDFTIYSRANLRRAIELIARLPCNPPQTILSAGQSTARSCHPYHAISVKAPEMMETVSTKNGGPVKGYASAAAAENSQIAALARIPNAIRKTARFGKAYPSL